MNSTEKPSVLVTGSAAGIGRATADIFAQAGYLVYAHFRNRGSDTSVIDDIRSRGRLCQPVFADLEQEAEIRTMFEAIPSLDVLVNNAGVVIRKKPVLPADFRRTLEINTVAPYLCCLLAREKGVRAIVNVGSMRGLPHCATSPDYSASKAALHNITAAMARAFAPDCRVNAVAPGFIRTGMHEGSEARLVKEAGKTPLQRVGEPEEIAHLIHFLGTEPSSFITGQVISADGGRSFSEG